MALIGEAATGIKLLVMSGLPEQQYAIKPRTPPMALRAQCA